MSLIHLINQNLDTRFCYDDYFYLYSAFVTSCDGLRLGSAASRVWWKFDVEKNRDFLQDGNLQITIYKQQENPFDY